MEWEQNIIDPNLFDPEDFNSSIDAGIAPVTVYKDQVINATQYLIEEFLSNKPIKDTLYKRAWFTDQLLTRAWHKTVSSEELTLVAVGGYGRRELHPYSGVL